MKACHDALLEEALGQMEALVSFRRRAFCAQPFHRDVSLPQLHILMSLREGGPMTVSQLAHLLGVSAPSASSLVDRMEEHALVVRERDLTDRRVVHVRISERGRNLLDEMMGMQRNRLQRVLGAMTEEELQNLIRGIHAVKSALDRIGLAETRSEDQAPSQLAPASPR